MSAKIKANPVHAEGKIGGALAGQESQSPVHYYGISGGLLGFWVHPSTLSLEQVKALARNLRIRPEIEVESECGKTYVCVKCKTYNQAWRLYQALKGLPGR